MKCKKCQKEINDEFKICPYCGEAVIPGKIMNEVPFDETDDSDIVSAEINTEINSEVIKEKTILDKAKKSPKKKGAMITIVIFLLLVAGAAGYYFLFASKPILTQISETIEASNEIDPMKLVALNSKDADKYTFAVEENTIKANVPGDYSVTYTLTNKKNNNTQDQTFNFKVVDTTPPEIRILTSEPIKAVLVNDINIVKLIRAIDIVDGEIYWEKVHIQGTVNQLGTYPLTISVSDNAGNKAEKTVNILIEEKGVAFDFISNINGYWINEATNNYCDFAFVNGTYRFSCGNYQIANFGSGILTFIEANSEKTIMKFNCDYINVTVIEPQKYSYSALTLRTVIVDTGIPLDNKISVDIGDGNGFQEYKYTTEVR